ncbi:hypothetical protein PHMEG_00020901 [Phytophthora megakarya]|uniref:Retrovirus-related Pol polyprotein from transposon TNT 1-94-like beta-barrel domain-containing protein n=1 Tax=Phytophthora megakarya TaxID=4795 RepID=A0A225VQI2_9STRA|nr:hypothetical protein PHMEG_00020901 [Phytophthora megakarya]
MAYDHAQNRKAEGSKGNDEERTFFGGGGRGRGRGDGRGRGRGRDFGGRGRGEGRGGASQGGGRGGNVDKVESGKGVYHEQEHHVRDCPYLGKRPPADNPSGPATPKRSKSGAGGKSAKAGKKVCDANGSDDSAYVVLSLMNLEKKVAAFAHDRWYLDTGATSHITNQKVDFVSFTSLSSTVRVGGKNWLDVFGVGTVCVTFLSSNVVCSLWHTKFRERFVLKNEYAVTLMKKTMQM